MTIMNEKETQPVKRAAHRRSHKLKQPVEDNALTTMGKFYEKFKNFSTATRYLLYTAPVGLALAVPIVVGSLDRYWAIDIGGVRMQLVFIWIEIFWLSLWVTKLFAKSVPWIFQFLCGIVSPGTRKYKSVISTLEIPISISGWALVSSCTFLPLMRQGSPYNATPSWANIMSTVLFALLISSLVLLAEKLLVQLISISYHHTQYHMRIKESKRNIEILSILYEASRSLFPAYCPEFAEEDYIINDSLEISTTRLGRNAGHARSGSGTPLRLLQNVGRFGDKVTAAFGNIATEVTGKQIFDVSSSHSIVVEALEKKKSSEALAKRIWMSLVVEGKDVLCLDDLTEVLSEYQRVNPEEAFAVLDKDGNGDVNLDEMIMTACELGRERKAIAHSLHDVDQAINVLNNMLLVVVLVITVFIFVFLLHSSAVTSLTGIGTSLLSLSFVFAVTTQEVLGSCIFLFVKHPFDVGDRVDIGGQQLTVERISLLYTVFRIIGSGKNTQVANIVLNTVWIDNVSRSHAMREQLLVYVSFNTSLEDITLLRDEMQDFVLDKENSRDFQSEVIVEVTGLAEMNKMELQIELRHKSNWSNDMLRAARRSKFLCALTLALRKIPIYAPGGGTAALGSADQPSYSVAVTDVEAAAARGAYAKSKEASRFKPSQPDPSPVLPATNLEPGVGGSAATSVEQIPLLSGSTFRGRSGTLASFAETEALANLNSRRPTSDAAGDWQQDGADPSCPLPPGYSVSNPDPIVRAESQRTRGSGEGYGMLRNSSNRGKRRDPHQLNSQAATPICRMPSIQEPAATDPSSAETRESSCDRPHGATSPMSRGSGGSAAYSPLDASHDVTDDSSAFGPGWNRNFIPPNSSAYESFAVPSTPALPRGQGQAQGESQAAKRYDPHNQAEQGAPHEFLGGTRGRLDGLPPANPMRIAGAAAAVIGPSSNGERAPPADGQPMTAMPRNGSLKSGTSFAHGDDAGKMA